MVSNTECVGKLFAEVEWWLDESTLKGSWVVCGSLTCTQVCHHSLTKMKFTEKGSNAIFGSEIQYFNFRFQDRSPWILPRWRFRSCQSHNLENSHRWPRHENTRFQQPWQWRCLSNLQTRGKFFYKVYQQISGKIHISLQKNYFMSPFYGWPSEASETILSPGVNHKALLYM